MSAQAFSAQDMANAVNGRHPKVIEMMELYISGVIDAGEGFSHCIGERKPAVIKGAIKAFNGHSGYGDEIAAHFLLKAFAQAYPCEVL